MNITVHVHEMHIHQHGASSAELRAINSRLERIMTTQAEFTAAFERVDVATSAIAAILRALAGNIGSMTAEEETAAKTRLEAVATSLEAMAVSPTNPVPVPAPA